MRSLILTVVFLAVAAPARGEPPKRPGFELGQTVYLGLGGLYSNAQASASYDLAPSGVGLSLIAGWRIFPYLGLEGAYEQWGTSRDTLPGIRNAATVRTLAGDLYAYWPMGRRGWFQPFATVGLGATGLKARQIDTNDIAVLDANNKPVLNTDGSPKMEAHRAVSPLASPSATHLRVGGGVEWTMFDDHIAGRVTARYQPYQLDNGFDHGTSISFALLARL